VVAELRARGHDALAPDLPAGDDSATLATYADAVLDELGERTDPVVVAQSFGGFTAPLVCERTPSRLLVLLAAMIPSPGEPPDDWWAATGYVNEVTPVGDDIATYYHDVPPALAEEAMRRERDHPSGAAMREPWPLERWPDVPTSFLLCRDDRFFPPAFLRRVARERLRIEPDEIDGGHCVALSNPVELADRLEAYLLATHTT
jgi:pimeloyl-ACP methyl ester carboxylesterase